MILLRQTPSATPIPPPRPNFYSLQHRLHNLLFLNRINIFTMLEEVRSAAESCPAWQVSTITYPRARAHSRSTTRLVSLNAPARIR